MVHILKVCVFFMKLFKSANSKIMENNPLFIEWFIAKRTHAILAFGAKILRS